MNLEQVRKEHKKELSQREEENEEMRCNTVKRVKGWFPHLHRLTYALKFVACPSFHNLAELFL